ncbi:hypothetical protein C0991_001835, partial [Blastosporella zonata]
MEELPAYEEVLASLEAIVSRDHSAEVRLAAVNKVVAEAVKTMRTVQVTKEATQLVESVIRIDQGFERVKIDLGSVDSGLFRGKPVEKLQPQWAGYQRRFVALIWKSNTVARKTCAYVREFVNVILPTLEDLTGNAEYKDAAADIREFAIRRNPFEHDFNDAQDWKHTQAFTDLRYDIKMFRDNFELFLEEQGISLDEEIVCLQEEISELDWQIKR